MPNYSVKPLEIALRPSRLLAAVLIGLHAMALLLTLVMPLTLGVKCILGLALAASLAYHLARHVLLRLPGSVTGIRLAADGAFSVCQGGDWLAAQVRDSSSVKPWLTVLNLKLEGRKLDTHVLLLPDGLEREAFRKLRVWLLWGRTPPP